ncbi:MAG: c-type cytochrome domain-containing protein, partial [Verrucomicrobiota bacterium]
MNFCSPHLSPWQQGWVLGLTLLSVTLCSSFAVEEEAAYDLEAVMPEKHFMIFDKYCLDCHDSYTEEGSVNLEELSMTLTDDLETAELWSKVLNTINSGEMPPKNKKQISDEEKTEFLRDLSEQMVLARSILTDSGGVIALRRLNRREYANT